jgi:hypothetical protein
MDAIGAMDVRYDTIIEDIEGRVGCRRFSSSERQSA